jgi:hypothetical protein
MPETTIPVHAVAIRLLVDHVNKIKADLVNVRAMHPQDVLQYEQYLLNCSHSLNYLLNDHNAKDRRNNVISIIKDLET